MMAYLDWSKAEDKWIEAQVAIAVAAMGDNPFESRRSGVDEIVTTSCMIAAGGGSPRCRSGIGVQPPT